MHYFIDKNNICIFDSQSFTFNDTGLETQRFYQKNNYNYITRFKFIYPLLILTRTPFIVKYGGLLNVIYIYLIKLKIFT